MMHLGQRAGILRETNLCNLGADNLNLIIILGGFIFFTLGSTRTEFHSDYLSFIIRIFIHDTSLVNNKQNLPKDLEIYASLDW